MSETKSVKMTPELLIEAPRRSPAVPNSKGTHALYTVTTYDLESHSETVEVKVMDISTGESHLFTDDSKNVASQWLADDLVIWQRSADGRTTELWVGSAVGDKKAYLAGKIDVPISDVKVAALTDGNIAIAFVAPISEDGELLNPEKADKPKTSAREYENILVRFWDTYQSKHSSTLWYTTLEAVNGKYRLSTKNKPIDALSGLGLEFPWSPTAALGGGGAYEISSSGLIVLTLDPEVNPAVNLFTGLWYIRLKTFTEISSEAKRILNTNLDYKGGIKNATFSSDGRYLAYIQQKPHRAAYYTGTDQLFVINLESSKLESTLISHKTEDDDFVEVDAALFSSDGSEIYLEAEYKGRVVIFKQKLDAGKRSKNAAAELLSTSGSLSAYHRLSDESNKLFITTSSMTDPSIYSIIDPPSSSSSRIVSDQMASGSKLGLHRSQVSEIFIKQTDDAGHEYTVQSYVTVPSDFDSSKTYPLCMLIHGGPQSLLSNAWSTRWNPAVFAEQGYVVLSPNPTGTPSFGQKFLDGVLGEWGGRAYTDIEAVFNYAEKEMKFVDTSRAVLGGGSYGGYMTNWIAGQPLGAKMKALFSHDGVFTLTNMLSSDIPNLLDIDVGAHLWDDANLWNKYAPSSYTHNWNTPMLIIHSDTDFRCPITEGLAAFNVCQMRGVPSRFLNFPDENHFVLKKPNSLQWYHSVLGWINYYAGVEGTVELKPALTRGSWRRGGGDGK